MNNAEIKKVRDGLLGKLLDLACKRLVILRGLRIKRVLLRLQAIDKASK